MKPETDTFYNDRLEEIKTALYNGDKTHQGGKGLADILLHCLIANDDITIETLFSSIQSLYREKDRILNDGGIMPADSFGNLSLGKDHMVYPCLDNELKFRMLHYGEDDWKEAKYVFYKMNITVGWDIVLNNNN